MSIDLKYMDIHIYRVWRGTERTERIDKLIVYGHSHI